MPETPPNVPRSSPWKPAAALLVPYTIVVAVAAVAMARRGASLPVEAKEVATRLQVSDARVYELIRLGLLPAVRIGRQVRVDPEKLDDFVRRGGAALREDR